MEHLKNTIKNLLEIVADLEKKCSPRKFTLDGHLLGSLGAAYAKEEFDLAFSSPYLLTDKEGNPVEIKVTQINRIAMRSEPTKLLVLKLNKQECKFEKIYYGEGKVVWKNADKPNLAGQRTIKLEKLKQL